PCTVGHPGPEVVAIGGGEGGQSRRLAAMGFEKLQQILEVAQIAIDGMRGAAALMRQPAEPLLDGSRKIAAGCKARIPRRVVFYGFGRSSHVRIPNSMTRPRKLMSSVPWPAWK